jgi:hypothetical protein
MKKDLLARNITSRSGRPARSGTISSPFFSPNVLFILKILLLVFAAFFCLHVYAQPPTQVTGDKEFRKAIKERSAKIVNTLGIADPGKYEEVLDALVAQYAGLNEIHARSNSAIGEIKAKSLSDEAKAEAITKQEEIKSLALTQRHAGFIAQLKVSLTEDQIEMVKDGMTYRVLPVTYAAYQDMLQNLTTEQKGKIYNWLKEARELAMDESRSEDKHKVFGKYKGRINNYLSAEGFDLKKETEAWQKRIKERQQKQG